MTLKLELRDAKLYGINAKSKLRRRGTHLCCWRGRRNSGEGDRGVSGDPAGGGAVREREWEVERG
jgi:hypothetical protein